MIKPPIPIDELLRLETLRRLNILDTEPEERFDRVTRLAKRIFGTSISLVSLVDAERQWFKSRQGLEATETPRDISFCGHAILDDEILVVNDTLEDERFQDNPLVTSDPNIRFYAGYPLSAPDGSKLGTLCVIDPEPRDVTQEDVKLLAELGKMIEEEFIVEDMMRDDPVTGLSNRAGFELIAEYLMAMCARTNSPASLMLFRLDIESTIYGSIRSADYDRAVIELAQLLTANFRNSDVVGRVSFNTFAVLLSGAQLDGSEKARKRLAELIQGRNSCKGQKSEFDVMDEIQIESFSISYDPDRHPTAEMLLQDAESGIDEAIDWNSADGTVQIS